MAASRCGTPKAMGHTKICKDRTVFQEEKPNAIKGLTPHIQNILPSWSLCHGLPAWPSLKFMAAGLTIEQLLGFVEDLLQDLLLWQIRFLLLLLLLGFNTSLEWLQVQSAALTQSVGVLRRWGV
jgi:hypothetical protein